MTAQAPAAPDRIFISYRRDETAYAAGWLYDRLVDHFGRSHIFKDVDSIQLGDDYVDVINEAVGSCDVLLALIGDRWLTVTDELGRRRLDDPADFVRLEIEAALARNVRIIPILVDGAAMPEAAELPGTLALLARRQALELSPSRFEFDTSRLLRVLDAAIAGDGKVARTDPQVGSELPARLDRRRPSRATLALIGGGVVAAAVVLVIALLMRSPGSDSGGSTAGSSTPAQPGSTSGSEAPESSGAGAPAPPPDASTAASTVASTDAQSDGAAPAGPVLFSDDFSGQDAGWSDVRQVPTNGFYVDGTYHVRAEPKDEGGGEVSSPLQADAMSPAPGDVRIDVAARRVLGSDRGHAYGVVCRLGGDNFYAFSAGADGVTIEKQVDYAPFNFQLASASTSFDPDASNHLAAECTTAGDGQSVHLVFTVNGAVVAETTDSDRPLPAGAVGVWAAMAPRPQTATQPLTAVEVEFDDFVVRAV